MLLAKHSQLQPVNCLISRQSISPNKERWRSGTKVVEQRVRINGRAAMSVKQARTGYSLWVSSTTGQVCLFAYRWDNLLFEVVKMILIQDNTERWTDSLGLASSVAAHIYQQYCMTRIFTVWLLPDTLLALIVMCVMCDSFSPSWTIKWEHFQMGNIWSSLIGQFLLPTCVAFFLF